MTQIMKTNFYNKGQGLIGIIIVLVVVGLISGGLYYYLSKQISEIPEIPEKPEEITPKTEEITPTREKPPIQKCVDGTPYGQCSVNKPKYCEGGKLIDKASFCGCPSDSKISDNHCIIEAPRLNPKSGLIVIKRGVSGANYAKEIASKRGWDILIVDTSDYKQIKKEISNFYNQKKFDYLFLIGTIEEIPYAVHDGRRWYAAPMLYGDVNDDRFIELAVGVLPFSSEAELKKYFTNLNPKGSFITLEHYSHHAVDAWMEYTYGRCLASANINIRTFKLSPPLSLANHYRESAVIFLKNAGTADAVYSAGMPPDPHSYIPVLHICSFDKNFNGELLTAEGEFFCDGKEIEYLTNRPIIFHYACSNAQKLGKQLVKNGAAAFFGSYQVGGFNIFHVQSEFLTGKSIGEAMKNVYNANVIDFTLMRIEGLERAIHSIRGLNTFDLAAGEELPYSTRFDFTLYGDPTLRLPPPLQKLNTNIAVEQRTDRIVIEVNSPKIFPSDADVKSDYYENLMCYTGEAVFGPSLVGKENKFWFNNHVLKLVFPLTKVNRLKSQKVIIGNQEINLDNAKGEEYTINLLKGKTEQYFYVVITNVSGAKGELNRLDYTKNIQIEIEYE